MLVVNYQAGKILKKLLLQIIPNWPKDLYCKAFLGTDTRVAFGHWLYYRFIVLSIVVSIVFRNSPEIHLKLKFSMDAREKVVFFSILLLFFFFLFFFHISSSESC